MHRALPLIILFCAIMPAGSLSAQARIGMAGPVGRNVGRFPGGARIGRFHDFDFGFGSRVLPFGFGLPWDFYGQPYWGFYGLPYWDFYDFYEQPLYPPSAYMQPNRDSERGEMSRVVVSERSGEQVSEMRPARPEVIEVPEAKGAHPAQPQPPALFVLNNGQRLQSRRYMLTSRNLYVTVDGRQRAFPLSALNLDATIAANRERGIEMRVPLEQSEIMIGF